MIRAGKVESILLTEKEIYHLSSGNYVLYNGQVAQIQKVRSTLKILASGNIITLSRDEMSCLKRIVVTLTYGIKGEKIEIRRFPLKFEQWQNVIEKKLLDTGVHVSFEVLRSSYAIEENGPRINTFIAIIISGNQKYTYTDSEVKLLVNNAMYHAVSTALLDIKGALVIEQEEIDRWWEYNKYMES
jgi:hypothetical protein